MPDCSDKSVAWGHLGGPWGSAEEVGELLGLIELGEDVWGDLISEVLHQGSLYEVTAPAIAWVVRFLKRSKLADKAIGTRRAPNQTTRAFALLSCAATSAAGLDKRDPYARDVLNALRQGIALYKAGLADDEIGARLASASILKAAATDRADAFASIAKCYERETESEVRVTMLSALNALAETGSEWLDRLLPVLESDTSDREKFYAVAYLASRLGSDTPEEIADHMAELFATLEEAKYPVELTNLEESDELFWDAARAMKRPRGVLCLVRTLELCDERDGIIAAHKVVSVTEWLLRLASNDKRVGWGNTGSSRGPKIEYGGIKPPDAPGPWLHSPEAKVALNAMVKKKSLWRVETNLLKLFGLPSRREELRDLLRTL